MLDFSIARATGQQHETLNGIVKGKSAYMSPEAVIGAGVDRRTDVWSLGVVLWELLTRQRLFKRDSDYETLRCVTESTVPAQEAVFTWAGSCKVP